MSRVDHQLVAGAAVARDIIESFRQWETVVPGWDQTLTAVIDEFVRPRHESAKPPDVDLDTLATDLERLRDAGLGADQRRLERVSWVLRRLVTLPVADDPQDSGG